MDKATIPAVVYISPSNLCTIDFKKVKTPATTKIITNNVTAIESNGNHYIETLFCIFVVKSEIKQGIIC